MLVYTACVNAHNAMDRVDTDTSQNAAIRSIAVLEATPWIVCDWRAQRRTTFHSLGLESAMLNN